MNICLLGNNLTNLVLANIFLKNKINVDIVSQTPAPILKNTIRTIAISSENYKFLKENIQNFKNLGWPTSMIKIYSERNRSSELFEFKNKNQNNFYLLKYSEIYELLRKNKLLNFIYMKLSIIIPVYNEIKTIKKLLLKVVNQQIKDIQIIVVDDFSTDGTTEVIKNDLYQYIDKIIYHEKNINPLICIKKKNINTKYITNVVTEVKDLFNKNYNDSKH